MKKIIGYYPVAIIFLFTACKKDTPPVSNPTQTTYVKLNPAGLEFVQLPVNSYFIYKDSATGSTDSVRVITSSIQKNLNPASPGGITQSAHPAYYSEKFTLLLKKFNGTISTDWFSGSASSFHGYTSGAAEIIQSSFDLLDDNNSLTVFWYPFTTMDYWEHSSLASVAIEGIDYSTVHIFTTTNFSQPTDIDYRQTIFYWVKGIGIIKKTIRTNNYIQTFLLTRHG